MEWSEMVGAAVLIFDERGRLLLIKRTDNGLWGLPGGAMEPGESLVQTAAREAKEEVGLDVEALQLFEVFSGPELWYRYPNGAEVYNVTVVYQTDKAAGRIQLGEEEHFAYQYFALDDLPDDTSPPVRPVLDLLVKSHNGHRRQAP